MHLIFDNLSTNGGIKSFNLEFKTSVCTVLFDPCETLSAAILSTLVGLDEITSGQLLIDGISHDEYLNTKNLLSTLGYVFDEGTMLSNLTLRENLLLPWHKRFESDPALNFETELQFWMDALGLQLDTNIRPALASPAQRKFMGIVRAFMLRPKLLLFDDPYYLFNKRQRQQLFAFLNSVMASQPMLIASADDDFSFSLADQVIDLSSFCPA